LNKSDAPDLHLAELIHEQPAVGDIEYIFT
jgi:hypothetical protein